MPDRAACKKLAAINGKLIETGVKYGSIPSLYPRYDAVLDANLSLSDDEVVFVVMLPGGARIYPQRIMVWHQVVNEIVDGKAYAITYCPTDGYTYGLRCFHGRPEPYS